MVKQINFHDQYSLRNNSIPLTLKRSESCIPENREPESDYSQKHKLQPIPHKGEKPMIGLSITKPVAQISPTSSEIVDCYLRSKYKTVDNSVSYQVEDFLDIILSILVEKYRNPKSMRLPFKQQLQEKLQDLLKEGSGNTYP
jgi:hypothetical protein